MVKKEISAGEWLLLTLVVLKIVREVMLILSIAINYRRAVGTVQPACLALQV